MNIITRKECGGTRGYVWYDSNIPNNGYRYKWSLNYDSIPEPKMFSEEYIAMYPEEFSKPSLVERVLNLLKIKQNEPRRRFKQS